VTDTPPRFPPEFFNSLSGGQESFADGAYGLALDFDSTARYDPVWIIDSAGDRPVRLTPLTCSRAGATVAFESLGVSGLITLTPHPSGWVKVVAQIDGQAVFTAFAEQVWEEYELYPDGWPDDARATATDEDAPGRIGKRRNWISLSSAAWPQLAPLASEFGHVNAAPAER
jgi:hypothetical protein